MLHSSQDLRNAALAARGESDSLTAEAGRLRGAWREAREEDCGGLANVHGQVGMERPGEFLDSHLRAGDESLFLDASPRVITQTPTSEGLAQWAGRGTWRIGGRVSRAGVVRCKCLWRSRLARIAVSKLNNLRSISVFPLRCRTPSL